MLKVINSKCNIMERIIGDTECLNCLFHNDTYNEPQGFIMCVFPNNAK